MTVLDPINPYSTRPVPELTPVHKAYKLASSQEPVTRIISNRLTKFQPRGESGRFLGYAKEAKGYLIWIPQTDNNGGTVKVRRDVIFHDFQPVPAAPDMSNEYLPLWDDIHFPDRLNTSPENDHPPSLQKKPPITDPQPTVPNRPLRSIRLPSKYKDFTPSDDIVNQLLTIDNDELLIPLPDGAKSATNIIDHILNAELILDEIHNIDAKDESNPPTV